MAERLRRRNSGDDRCQADVFQSRKLQSAVKRDAHSDGNQLSSHCFHFTSFCEGSLPKQKIHQTSRDKRAQERRRLALFLLKNRTMSCSIKHGMVTLESLWTRIRSRKPGSLRWSITTNCTDRQGALERKMG